MGGKIDLSFRGLNWYLLFLLLGLLLTLAGLLLELLRSPSSVGRGFKSRSICANRCSNTSICFLRVLRF